MFTDAKTLVAFDYRKIVSVKVESSITRNILKTFIDPEIVL